MLERNVSLAPKYSLTEMLVLLENVLLFLIVLCTMLQQTALVSLLFALTFVLLFYAVLRLTVQGQMPAGHVLTLLSIAVISYISVLFAGAGVSVDHLKKLVIFLSTLMFFLLASHVRIGKQTVRLVLLLNIATALLYPLGYFVLHIDAAVAGAATLNFSNSNLTGMYVMHALLYAVLAMRFFAGRRARVGLGLLAPVLLYVLYITQARACFIAVALFVVLYFCGILRRQSWPFCRTVIILLLLFPILFAVLYLLMGQVGILDLLSFADTESKPVDSRIEVWGKGFDIIRENLILGNAPMINSYAGFSHLHNTHVDVLASYGIIVFVLFLVFLCSLVLRVADTRPSMLRRAALLCFFCVILQGTFEAALVSGGVGLYILSGGFLLIAHASDEVECEETDATIPGNAP